MALYFLGSPRFELEGAAFELRRRKVLALLVYLAVTAQRHSREILIELLYPKQDRKRARSDFRQTLSLLKSTIGGNWLRVERNSLALPAGRDLWIDVHEFRRLIVESRQLDRDGNELEAANLLTKAAALYRGEFLSGFYLKDSYAFDEWQFFEQESLRREYAFALERLSEIYNTRGELELAIDYGRKWLSLDSLDEAVHRHLMQLYSLSGQRTAALRQYKKCKALLEKELGEAPDEETDRLREKIQTGQVAPEGQRTDQPLGIFRREFLFSSLQMSMEAFDPPAAGRKRKRRIWLSARILS